MPGSRRRDTRRSRGHAAAVPAEPVAPAVWPTPRPVNGPELTGDVDQEQELVLEDLTREQVPRHRGRPPPYWRIRDQRWWDGEGWDGVTR